MGLIDKPEKFHYQFVPYANVVFDLSDVILKTNI